MSAGPRARGPSRFYARLLRHGRLFSIYLMPSDRPSGESANRSLFDRIGFVAGDFYRDELPPGVDFAWVSAIIHQHAREDSRALFAKVYRALGPGGRIGIRDFVMDPDHTHPAAGALFAVNMLANTDRGNTFTYAEIAEDLEAAGFKDVDRRIKSDDMNSVVMAVRP